MHCIQNWEMIFTQTYLALLWSLFLFAGESSPFNKAGWAPSASFSVFWAWSPSRDLTLADRTSIMVSVYPISCKYLSREIACYNRFHLLFICFQIFWLCTWWRLLQKSVVHIKFDIYICYYLSTDIHIFILENINNQIPTFYLNMNN
jgi:hypothetical protein